VFCASLADVGDNHRSIAQEWRDELRELVAQTPNLIWLFLTKRPQNIARFYPQWMERWPENVWIGTTVENQTEADRRVPELLRLPAPVRFLSCEPLLGPLRLDRISETDGEPSDGTISGWHIDALEGTAWDDVNGSLDGEYQDELGGASIQWVICGGESGPGARQMHPDWARSLRDQCQDAGVSYFFKQWGDWGPCDHLGDELDGVQFGCFDDAGNWHHPCSEEFANAGREIKFRVSKKAAGRLLDGRERNGVPTR
jgi:protein gp37